MNRRALLALGPLSVAVAVGVVVIPPQMSIGTPGDGVVPQAATNDLGPSTEPGFTTSVVPPGELAAQDAAQVVMQLAGRFPQSYAGVELLQGKDEGKVAVYRKPSPDFDQALRELRLPAGSGVVARDAPYSAVELKALIDRIGCDFDHWPSVPITTVGPRHDGTAVEVGTSRSDLDQVHRMLVERYGAAPPIVVVQMGPIDGGLGVQLGPIDAHPGLQLGPDGRPPAK